MLSIKTDRKPILIVGNCGWICLISTELKYNLAKNITFLDIRIYENGKFIHMNYIHEQPSKINTK